jgi:adenosylmethionine-8-amino-7-oxononanoate aminotransferase
MELVSGPDKAGLCYVLTIAPPLIITESQAEEIVTTVREALAAH